MLENISSSHGGIWGQKQWGKIIEENIGTTKVRDEGKNHLQRHHLRHFLCLKKIYMETYNDNQ